MTGNPAMTTEPAAMTAEEVVRLLYERVAANDLTSVLALLADDVEFVQADGLPFGGRYQGRSGFETMAQLIFATWPGFAVKPVAFMGDGGERVVVLAELSGKGLQMPMLELWTVRHGLVTRCQPFYFDTAAVSRS